MNKQLKLMLIVSSVITFGAANADTSKALVDNHGNVVKNGFNDCVVTSFNKETTECGAKPKMIADDEITLPSSALFDFNKSIIKQSAKIKLDKIANGIDKTKSIKIIGHTDNIGTIEYNQKLSERRANAVRDYLITRGVSSSKVSAKGEGELNPIADNSTASGRQKNRRAEVVLEIVGK